MATPRFNQNILDAARRLKASRSAAGPAGDTDALGNTNRYSSALLTSYQNRAVRDIIAAEYAKGIFSFQVTLPEYIKTSEAFDLTGSVDLAADMWHVIELTAADLLTVFDQLDQSMLQISGLGHGLVNPTYKHPVYWEQGRKIYAFPPTKDGTTKWSVMARYIQMHQDIAVDGATDLLIAAEADGSIVDAMVALGLADSVKTTQHESPVAG